jgi:hypothetical protein
MFPRSRETWGPILQLADLFDRLGVVGLLEELQAFAVEKTATAQDVTVDESHEAILRALVGLVKDDLPTTSGAILKRALAEGLDPSVRLSDRAVGKILRSYGFKQHRSSKSRVWVVPAGRLASIAKNYGIKLADGEGLGDPKNSVTSVTSDTPVTASSESPAKSPDSVGVSCDTSETHRDDPPEKVSQGSPSKTPEKERSNDTNDTSVTNDTIPGCTQTLPTSDADTVSGEVEL